MKDPIVIDASARDRIDAALRKLDSHAMRINPDWPEAIKRAMRAWRDDDVPAIMRDETPPEVLPHPDMVAP